MAAKRGEKNSQPRVVIVGAGFGGLQAARGLEDAPVHVTVVDRSNHHLFQPLLYQVATAGLSPADIAAPIRNILHSQENVEVRLAEVSGVDVDTREVEAGNIRLPYDYLILATGATHSYFGHDSWEAYAPGLKSISDATSIRREILRSFESAENLAAAGKADSPEVRALMTFVLVGAGPTGVEMAGAIAELAHRALVADFRHINPRTARILLLEAGPRILLAFPDGLAAKARAALEQMGVEVRTNCAVEDIREGLVMAAGEQIPSDNVIWTAGVGASPAGKWLGVATDRAGRVMVRPDLTVEGHPEIFVIGDTAHVERNGKLLPGVAPVAMQQGRYVAASIRRRLAGQEAMPFRYKNKGNLATVGRSFAIMDLGVVHLSGFLAWVLWLTIHIFYLIGFRNRLLVMVQWAWAYFTAQRGARLIVSSPSPEPARAPVERVDEAGDE